MNKFDSKTIAAHSDVVGISSNPVRIRKKVNVSIQPWFENGTTNRIESEFWVLPKSSKWSPILPEQNIPCSAITKRLKPTLADPMFWKSGSVSILLGIEVWAEIIEGTSHKLGRKMISQESTLGNLISGKFGETLMSDSNEKGSVYMVDMSELDKSIQKFWEFEDLSLCAKKNSEHDLVETILSKRITVMRTVDMLSRFR